MFIQFGAWKSGTKSTLVIGMDSPVSMDSLTTQVPSIRTASHSIMTPPLVGSNMTSPGTKDTDDNSVSEREILMVSHLETLSNIPFLSRLELGHSSLG